MKLFGRIKPILICGTSGAGKSTLIKYLMNKYPGKFSFCVSATTRPPRKGEHHGFNYYFVSDEEFAIMKESNEFLEYCMVHGNYYGTPMYSLEDAIEDNKIPILDLDLKGTSSVMKIIPEANSLFITTSSIDILEERLRNRGSESEDTLRTRLENSQQWMDHIENERQKGANSIIKEVLINDELDTSKAQLLKMMHQLYPHLLDQD